MILKDTQYSYDDLTLMPAAISNISSRSECDPYINDKLPIFASCMSTVVSEDNYKCFEDNKITPVIPRNVAWEARYELLNKGKWVAMSLSEFRKTFIDDGSSRSKKKEYKVCIDIANGHMSSLYKMCIKAKQLSLDNNYIIYIMTGNIANPATYRYICDEVTYENNGETLCAVDYIRLGIGSGSMCTTTSNVGVHYPIASLIDQCNAIKMEHISYPKQRGKYPYIIADGGIRNYDHVIKALALGADYVMIGGLFAAFYESASPLLIKTEYNEYITVDYVYSSEEKKRKDIVNRQLWKECYGMSTKKAQSLIGKATKTAEGKHSMLRVKYTIAQWVDNMEAYLKSAMSYCNVKTLRAFIGCQKLVVNSPGTRAYVNK